jgi:DNA-binding GntR family transcriptional regulator
VDDEFHDTICRLSGRTVICDTLTPLHRKTRRYRRISMEDWDRTTRSTREHFAIYEAIANRDAELAKKLTKEHIQFAKAHMIKEV